MQASNQTPSYAMTRGDWATLVGLSLVWGCTFPIVKTAVREIPPVTLVLLRVGIASLTLWAILRLSRVAIPRGRAIWSMFFVMGLIGSAAPWTFFFWGQQFLPSGVGAIMNATTPLFSALMGHFLLGDERLTGARLAGVLVGFAGVAVLIGPGLLVRADNSLLALGALATAALLYALSGFYGRRFAPLGLQPLQSAFGQLTTATLIMAPIALAYDRPWTLAAPSAITMASVVFLAVVATAFAFVLFFRVLASAGATNVMLVTLLVPATATTLGVLLLDEHVEWRHMIGMAIILCGLLLMDGRVLKLARR